VSHLAPRRAITSEALFPRPRLAIDRRPLALVAAAARKRELRGSEKLGSRQARIQEREAGLTDRNVVAFAGR
jgi:hypothetical protein